MQTIDPQESDLSRRNFLKNTAAGAAVAAVTLSGLHGSVFAQDVKTSALVFPPLPYPENALEPYLSSRTLSIHHDRHHRKYLEQTIERIKGTDFQNAPLEKIIRDTNGGINMAESLNQMAIMAWNHDFYWKSMKPKGGGEMPAKLKQAVTGTFGSVDEFKKKFKEAALTFGSGWAWLVLDKGKMAVTFTKYQETPLVAGQTPLLTIDTWEHAYYLDYQDRKADYVDAFINSLANWQFAESNMTVAASPAPAEKTAPKAK